jgi:GDP-L-fucose synthase
MTLAKMVLDIAGKNLPIQLADNGLGREYSGDNARLLAETGDYQFADLKTSIAELYTWYESRRDTIDRSLL